jgi:hypothetical protein
MKVSLVATLMPPPHLARADLTPERHAKDLSHVAVGLQIATLVEYAVESGLFAAGGCVNVVVQLASTRPPSDGLPQ